MVSLADESSRRNGGFPFDEWSQSVQDTDELLDGPTLHQPDVKQFQPVNTTWSIVLLLICSVALEISLFLVPYYCDDTECGPPSSSLLFYIHGGLWFMFMLLDRYWRYQHYMSRTHGYLDFYRQTRHIRRIPVLVFSGGTAMLLILSVLLGDYCSHTDAQTDHCPNQPLSKSSYVQILVSLEVAIIVPVLILYMVRTVRFNKSQPAPDIQQEEAIGSFSRSQGLSNGIGFRDETFMDEILEKQADMIRYLKHHNTHLGRKILQLTAQLDQSSS